MPYIKSDDGRREELRNREPALTAGELNYQIFYYVKHYCINSACKAATNKYCIKTFVENFLGEHPNYQRYNDMTGCLVRCAKEIKRRLYINDIGDFLIEELMDSYDDEIAKYENIKIIANGDVE